MKRTPTHIVVNLETLLVLVMKTHKISNQPRTNSERLVSSKTRQQPSDPTAIKITTQEATPMIRCMQTILSLSSSSNRTSCKNHLTSSTINSINNKLSRPHQAHQLALSTTKKRVDTSRARMNPSHSACNHPPTNNNNSTTSQLTVERLMYSLAAALTASQIIQTISRMTSTTTTTI